MGYIRHRTVIAVVTHNHQIISEFVNDFREKLNNLNFLHLTLLNFRGEQLIIESADLVNLTKTYIFVPDGSKLGWPEAVSTYRESFMRKMKELGADCLYLEFGGDGFGRVLIDNGH